MGPHPDGAFPSLTKPHPHAPRHPTLTPRGPAPPHPCQEEAATLIVILQDAETATKSEAGTTPPNCGPTLPLGKSKSGESGLTRSVVICEGERERVTGCETVGE